MWWLVLLCLSPALFIVGWLVCSFLCSLFSGDSARIKRYADRLLVRLQEEKCSHCQEPLLGGKTVFHNIVAQEPIKESPFDTATVVCPKCGTENSISLLDVTMHH